MTPQREMPRYLCHKEVWALKIASIDQAPASQVAEGGSWLIQPADDGYAAFEVPHSWYAKHFPQPGGYYVVYADGYKSYSPAKAFEEGYTPIPADFRDRVRAEAAELDNKTKKLHAFFSTEAFAALDPAERERLTAQYAAMCDYSNVLSERIAAFG